MLQEDTQQDPFNKEVEDTTGLDDGSDLPEHENAEKYSSKNLAVFRDPDNEEGDHRVDLLIGAKNHERLLAAGMQVVRKDDAPATGVHVKPTGDMFDGTDQKAYNDALDAHRRHNRCVELFAGSPKNVERLEEFGYTVVKVSDGPLTPHTTDGRSAAKVADRA